VADPLLECVPNVSEGRDPAALASFAEAIARVPGVRLLDRHADGDHHRAVFTFLGPPDAVERAALSLAETVFARVDMRRHRGIHPRMGALDVLPFVPLRNLTLEDAVRVARRVGAAVAAHWNLPVYFYGAAASDPARRALRAVRRGEYEGLAARLAGEAGRPDAGPARFDPRLGATAVGAREILVAYNIWLDSDDLSAARAIAATVRESSGGLPGVQALGLLLPSQRLVQVSMNLLEPRRTGIGQAWDAVTVAAARRGLRVLRAELVGMLPRTALEDRPPEAVGLAGLEPAKFLDPHVTGGETRG
jgi:glutamate formiminotransferase